MSAVRSALVRQFGKPSGLLGTIAGLIMRARPSNRERNVRTLVLLDIRPEDHVLEVGFGPDRKSTRLNSSHVRISYAVFCLKKKTAHVDIQLFLQPPHTHDKT